MNGFQIDIDEVDDNVICGASQKICTMVANTLDEETIKAIYRYCEENNIYPNIIDETKLKLILRLGIQEYNKRNLESEVN